jgi:hypothetical protein
VTRIASVKSHPISVPLKDVRWTAHEELKASSVIVVEVRTEDGLTGYGHIFFLCCRCDPGGRYCPRHCASAGTSRSGERGHHKATGGARVLPSDIVVTLAWRFRSGEYPSWTRPPGPDGSALRRRLWKSES